MNRMSFVSESKISFTRGIQPRIVENFIVIWLNVQSNEFNKTSINQLQKLVNTVETFSDREQCLDYLSHIENEKVFLIISNSFNSEFLSLIEPMSQLSSIYLLTNQKLNSQQYTKIKGIYNKTELICTQIKSDLYQYENTLNPISTLLINDSNELDQSFLYSQLIKEIILDMDYDELAKVEFIEYSSIQYYENDYQLQIINEFEQDYQQSKAIWWYTRDCFIKSMLNRALRIQDTEIILKMAFFIRDLHEQIEEIYSDMDKSQSLVAYYGQGLLNNQVEKLLKSKGQLLSFNNFLFVNTNRDLSLNIAKQSLNKLNLTSILFKIELNPSSNSSTPFAFINKHSYSNDAEKEILFSMHTIFHINDVKQIQDHVWEINLILTNDTDEQLNKLIEYTNNYSRAESSMHRLAKLMFMLGNMDKAKEIYNLLIETTVENDKKELAHLHHQLGIICEEKEDLINALSHYYQSLNFYLTYLPLNDPQLCTTYSNIGLILKKQGNLDGALEYLQHALDISLIAPNPDQSEIAIRYNNIGGVLDAQGKCPEALENYQHALEIESTCVPFPHPLLSTTHNNIALVYQSMKDYASALKHFEKALEIEEMSLSSDHPSLIMTYANLAGVFENLHQYKQAIKHAEKAVKIVENSFGSDYPYTRILQDYFEQLKEKE